MKSQRGQTLVETALILPIILLLIFAITDFGRIFHAYLTIDHAGREAARTATIGGDDLEIRAKVLSAISGLEQEKLQLQITPDYESRSSGDEVNIELYYNIDFITPFFGSIIPPVTIKDITVMRVE